MSSEGRSHAPSSGGWLLLWLLSLSPSVSKIGKRTGGCCWPGARGQPISGPLFLVTSSRKPSSPQFSQRKWPECAGTVSGSPGLGGTGQPLAQLILCPDAQCCLATSRWAPAAAWAQPTRSVPPDVWLCGQARLQLQMAPSGPDPGGLPAMTSADRGIGRHGQPGAGGWWEKGEWQEAGCHPVHMP